MMKRYSVLILFGLTALAGADEPAKAKRDYAWVAARVDAWQPRAEERAFDRIDWVERVTGALELGQREKRPVFLFTYDGASLADYRC